MVRSCCVRGCSNRSCDGTGKSFHRIPTVCTAKTQQTRDVTEKRRREWLAQLKLKNIKFDSAVRWDVCSDHFINGKPSYLYAVNDPDWKPTLKLGHEEARPVNSTRFDRQRQRMSQTPSETPTLEESQEDYASDDGRAETPSLAAPAPDRDEHGGVFCQTEGQMSNLTIAEEKSMRDELNRLTQENVELKETLRKKTVTIESLEGDDETVKYFTGLNYMTLAAVFNFVSAHLPNDKRRALSTFQSLWLTLIRLRLNTPLIHLAYMFSVSRTTSSKVFHETISVLHTRLSPVVFWPDKESIKSSLPWQFLEHPWHKVVSIIDCFEIFIERPSSPEASAMTWSNYKHNNTIKYLISITPQGHISFISKGWGGRSSDKKVTQLDSYLRNLLPNDFVLADRGFDIDEIVAMFGAEVRIPAFTKGKIQLHAHEIESTRKLAHLRIHVERVIGVLIGKYTILNSIIPIELLFARAGEELTTLDKMVTVGCALVNMCESIM